METDPTTEQLGAVRTAIDEIDEEIVALIWRRERLVRLAGGLKDDDAQVRARDRVEEVINHVREAAKAQEHWFGFSFNKEDMKQLVADANAEMRRLF